MRKKIIIEFPVGAGGTWLQQLFERNLNGGEWSVKKANFYNNDTFFYTQQSHNSLKENNCTAAVSFDNPSFRYSFWKSYMYNRVIGELDFARYNNRRIFQFDNNETLKENFYTLQNACGNVQNFSPSANTIIDYKDIWTSPSLVQEQINSITVAYGHTSRGKDKLFTDALANFRKTRNKFNTRVNTHSLTYKIWALTYLTKKEVYFSDDIFEKFNSKKFNDFLNDYQNEILEYTAIHNLTI